MVPVSSNGKGNLEIEESLPLGDGGVMPIVAAGGAVACGADSIDLFVLALVSGLAPCKNKFCTPAAQQMMATRAATPSNVAQRLNDGVGESDRDVAIVFTKLVLNLASSGTSCCWLDLKWESPGSTRWS